MSVCRGAHAWNPAVVLWEAQATWGGHGWVFEWTAGIHHLMCGEASFWKIPTPSLGLPDPAAGGSITELTHPPHRALSVFPGMPDGCRRPPNRGCFVTQAQ